MKKRVDKENDEIEFYRELSLGSEDTITFDDGELSTFIHTDDMWGGIVEMELSKEETKELYEFMKGYYEKETT